MGEISVWYKGQPKQIGGVSHKTTAAAIVGFVLTDGLWDTDDKARRSGRCYALFENWRGCQRLIPPWKRIYKLWKLWGLERIHVKFVVKKVAMETLVRKDFEEYVEVSQLKVPKRHIALRMEPHATGEDVSDSDDTSSTEDTGLYLIDDTDGGVSPGTRRKRTLLNRVVRQNEQLRDITRTVEDVDEEILFYEAKLHHCRVVEGGKDYVQEAYLTYDREAGALTRADGNSLDPSDPYWAVNDTDQNSNEKLTGSKETSHETDPENPKESDENLEKSCDNPMVQTSPRNDFNKKCGTKVVVVNPLPRNNNSPNMGEQNGIVKNDSTDSTSQTASDTKGNGLVSSAFPADQERSTSALKDKTPLRSHKRHDRYGGRVKKRTTGLYEFEQSCDWLSVMDKELKRLESIENLSFVDWDSESLLSDKDLAFYGGRKYKFRPTLSGRNGKPRVVCNKPRTKANEEICKKITKLDLAEDREMKGSVITNVHGNKKENATDGKTFSSRTNFEELAKSSDKYSEKSQNVDSVENTKKITTLAEIKSCGAIAKKSLFPFAKKSLNSSDKNLSMDSTGQPVPSSRSIGTTTAIGSLAGKTEDLAPQLRRTDGDVALNLAKTNVRRDVYDLRTEGDNEVKSTGANGETLVPEERCTKGNAQSKPQGAQLVSKGILTMDTSKTGSNLTDIPKPDAINSKANHCKMSKRVSFLSDRMSAQSPNPGPQQTVTRYPLHPSAVSNNLIPVPRCVVPDKTTPMPVPRHSVSTNTSGRPMAVPEANTSSEKIETVSNSPKIPNPNTSAVKNIEGQGGPLKPIPEPHSSPVSVRRVPKPPIYYPSDDSGPTRYQGTNHSIAKTLLKGVRTGLEKCENVDRAPTVGRYACFSTPVHPRVEQLRSLHPKEGFSLTPADYTKVSTKNDQHKSLDNSNPVSFVGVVTCTSGVKESVLKEEHSCLVVPTPVPSPPLAGISSVPVPMAKRGVSPAPLRVQSPDQGLGQELPSPREDTKIAENDSSSDAGMGSVHSQDSGISNASVVIETWV